MIATKHKDIEITYNEAKDHWEFQLRGRERSAGTLLKAKAAIDAPPPKDEKPFERFEAWMATGYSGSSNYQRVTVTSVKDDGPDSKRYWITYEGRRAAERQLVSAFSLHLCNPENDALIEKISAKNEVIKKLVAEREEVAKKLKSLDKE